MATINLEGFGQVEIRDDFLDLSPEERIAEIQRVTQAQPEAAPEEDVSTFRDVAEGVGAGLVGVAQGISETVAAGYDLTTDSDTSRGVTESFESVKKLLGFTPETTAGEVASLITNFGLGAFVPLTWVSRAKAAATGTSALNATSALGRSAQAFGSSKAGGAIMRSFPGRLGVTSLGIGTADFMVSPTGLTTLSDAFDALPDELETEEDTGLTGRDEAARRLRNKLRIAAEGAALQGAIDIAIPVIGKTVGTAAVLPGIAPVARGINHAFGKMGDFARNVSWLNKNFTSTGGLPRDAFEFLQDARGGIDEQANTVVRLLEDFDATARKVVGSQIPFLRTKDGMRQAYSDLETFLEGDIKALDGYGTKTVESATRLRTQIDDLSDKVGDEVDALVARNEMDADEGFRIKNQIERNRGKYLRRLYEGPEKITNPAEFRSTPEYGAAVKEVRTFLARTSDDDADTIAQRAIEFVDGQLGFKPGIEGLDPAVVMKDAAKNLAKINGGAKPDIPLYDLSDNILSSRNQLLEAAPTLRKLKGEKLVERMGDQAIKERAVRTVTDLSTFANMSKFYRSLIDDPNLSKSYEEVSEILNAGGRPMIIRRPMDAVDETGNPIPRPFDDREINTLNQLGYVRLGDDAGRTIHEGPYGSMTGAMVRSELKDVLTFDRVREGVLNTVLAVALQAKGISQIGQTVFNPVGQIRNIYGNKLMLLANGNVAGFHSIADSISLAMAKPGNLSDAEYKTVYNWIGDLGLRDQNVIMNEFRSLMREGKEQITRTEEAVRKATEKSMERFIPGYNFLSKTYAGADNAGKTASLFAERAKYANAFRRAGIDMNNLDPMADSFINTGLAVRRKALNEDIPFDFVMAADITKATMPIYSRVPDAVKAIRRIPVMGNFIAFPAEVIRNSANILQRSMREMGVRADDFIDGIKAANPNMSDRAARIAAERLVREIKAIGAKRLTGLSSVALTVPAAVQTSLARMNGMSDQELEDLQRFGAPYQRGHLIAPIAKVGNKWETIDISYMMPYDYLIAPIRNAQRTFAEKGEVDSSTAGAIMSSVFNAGMDLLEPFAGESLITERFLDVSVRNGRTDLGSFIYREGDDTGEKLSRSFTHVLGGFNPAMMKYIVDIKAGEAQPGRLLRAVTDEPGRQGQEFTVQEELLSLLTGFRKQEIDMTTAMDYKGFEYTSRANSIKSRFRSTARAADTSVEELSAEYRDLQNDLQLLQAELYQDVRAAERLGMTRSQIRKNLKDARIGNKEIRDIMRGRFSPYMPSSQLARDVRKKAREQENRLLTRLPMSELRGVARDFRGLELARPEPVQVNPAPQLPSAPAPATMAPATAPQSSTSPTLLGDNPIEQARNLELANRLRGQK